MKKKWFWFSIIVLLSLGIITRYAFSYNLSLPTNEYGSDASREFQVMLAMMKQGAWHIEHVETLLKSCLFTTYFPALIALHLHLDPEMVYRIFPLFFMVWTPAIVYLIARRYMPGSLAVIVALVFASQNYFQFSSSTARFAIALMFFSLATLIIVNNGKHLIRTLSLLSFCAIGIVLSHYGVAFASIFFLGLWGVIRLILLWKRKYSILKLQYIMGLFIFVLLFSVLWHGVILQQPWKIGQYVIKEAISEVVISPSTQTPILTPTVTSPPGMKQAIIMPSLNPSLFSLDSREMTVQVAFGKTFPTMNIAQRVQFIVTWLIIVVFSWGLVLMLRRKLPLGIACLSGYLLILLTMALPNPVYSVTRVYCQASIFLMIGLGLGITWLSERVKLSPSILGLVFLIPYALSTSGILHSWLSPILLITGSATPAILVVNPPNSDIVQAITSASEGETVVLPDGIHLVSVNAINLKKKGITVQGSRNAIVRLMDSQVAGYVIGISADNCTLKGFGIDGNFGNQSLSWTNYMGVELYNKSKGAILDGLYIKDVGNDAIITIDGNYYTSVIGCEIDNCGEGILFQWSNYFKVVGNILIDIGISSKTTQDGIESASSSYGMIQNNNIFNVDGSGIDNFRDSNHNVIINNTIQNFGQPDNGLPGIALQGHGEVCKDNAIVENKVIGGLGPGIWLWEKALNNMVIGNEISGTRGEYGQGIKVDADSPDNSICSNKIVGGNTSIMVLSGHTRVLYNEISHSACPYDIRGECNEVVCDFP